MQNISSPPQANAEVVINENFVSAGPASLYGIRQPATTGLTWAYWGGQFNGNTISNGTVSLTASNTNYVVAARSNGAVTAATSTTNWNNSTDYMRLYSVVTGTSSITSYVDFRQAYGGAGSGGGGATDFTDLGDVPSDYTGEAGKYVRVNGSEDGLEFVSGSGGGASDFTDLGDVPSDYTGEGGKYVRVNNTEDGLEFVSGSSGGADDFVDLGDVPSSYTGEGGKVVAVKGDESGLEFISAGGGSANSIGVYSSRPAASTAGDGYIYYATDTLETYRSNGSTWVVVGGRSELGYAEISSVFSTTSTTFVDVTGLTFTAVAGERPMILEIQGHVNNSGGSARAVILGLYANGNLIQGEKPFWMVGTTNYASVYARARIAAGVLTPGTTYTFKAMMRVDASTGNLHGDSSWRPFLRLEAA